jgi:hypothetical protein
VKQVESGRPTVRELADRFVREFIDVYLKPSSAICYRKPPRRHILPVLGDRDFETVTRQRRADATRQHEEDPGLGQLRALHHRQPLHPHHRRLGAADMKNPAHGVRRFKMKTRERFLTPEERAHVEEVLLRGLQISTAARATSTAWASGPCSCSRSPACAATRSAT